MCSDTLHMRTKCTKCTLHTATVVILGPSARTVAVAKQRGLFAPLITALALPTSLRFAPLVASQVNKLRKTSSESSARSTGHFPFGHEATRCKTKKVLFHMEQLPSRCRVPATQPRREKANHLYGRRKGARTIRNTPLARLYAFPEPNRVQRP